MYVNYVVHLSLYRGARVLGKDAKEASQNETILTTVITTIRQGGNRAIVPDRWKTVCLGGVRDWQRDRSGQGPTGQPTTVQKAMSNVLWRR